MRFVQPDSVRINLQSLQADGKTQHWIEVKKELSKREDARYRTRGFKRVSTKGTPRDSDAKAEDTGQDVDVDWEAMALARVEAFLVDWSARMPDGKGGEKDMPVTRDAIGALDTESFEEIDKAIQAHMEGLEAEKKRKPGSAPPTPSSQS